MPKPLKWGILGARTRILSEDIHNYILFVVLTDVRYFEKVVKFDEISVDLMLTE
jgi:hypothetical protein